jgi:hypothetical protein
VIHSKVNEGEPDFDYLNKMTDEDEKNAFGAIQTMDQISVDRQINHQKQ